MRVLTAYCIGVSSFRRVHGARWQAAKDLATVTYMSLSSTVEKLRLIEGFGYIITSLVGLAELLRR
jgi:hypothetical protein